MNVLVLSGCSYNIVYYGWGFLNKFFVILKYGLKKNDDVLNFWIM